VLRKSSDSISYMSVVSGILVLQARETKSEVPTIKNKKVEKRLDKLFPSLYNSNNEANNTVGSLQGSKVHNVGNRNRFDPHHAEVWCFGNGSGDYQERKRFIPSSS
jgi:hypothetical protein